MIVGGAGRACRERTVSDRCDSCEMTASCPTIHRAGDPPRPHRRHRVEASMIILMAAQAAYNPGRDGGVRMRLRYAAAIASFLIGSHPASLAITAFQDSPPSAETLARETLGPNDGWASFSGGTTGGAAATADHVYTVTNRQEL